MDKEVKRALDRIQETKSKRRIELLKTTSRISALRANVQHCASTICENNTKIAELQAANAKLEATKAEYLHEETEQRERVNALQSLDKKEISASIHELRSQLNDLEADVG